MSDPPASQNTRKILVRVGHDEGLTNEAVARLMELGLPHVAKKACVTWNKKLRTTAGRAYSAQALSELNPRLQLLETDWAVLASIDSDISS